MAEKAVLPAAPPPPEWGNVPAEMAGRKQWLLWRFEIDPERATAKPLKMPYYVDGGKRYKDQGGDLDRRRLATLAQVRQRYERGGFSGIGFAFLPDDGLIGIDIDGAIDRETGEISELCESIIRMCDSFTELSPSGKGVHIFVKGTTETNKSNDIGLEMFCGKQFFTVTANQWSGSPRDVRDIDPDVVAYLHETINEAKEKAKAERQAEKIALGAPPPPVRAPRPAGQGGADDFRRVNDAAMAAFPAWVTTLFPKAIAHGQGYRVTSKALGRDLQEDLAIDPRGIKDWGVADMGDARDGARTPIDLVMEWLPESSSAKAMRWLAQRVGVEVAPPIRQTQPPAERTAPQGEGITPAPTPAPVAQTDADPATPAETSNVVSLVAKKKKEPAAPRAKKPKPEPDWGKLDYVLDHFVLIYGTDMVWDDVKRISMKIGNMAHAHGADIVRMWKSSAMRRTVMEEDIVFDPTQTCDPQRCINLYNGFAMEPEPCAKEDVAVMLELLRHLCGNCSTEGVTIDQVMHWVLCWLALPLQRPGGKPRSALIFHGPQGTGKNLFFDAIRSIYGPYGVMVGQNELEEKYNSWLSAKLLVLGNEVVTRQELYHNKNKLKWVITEDKIPIRPMHMDVRWESNHANVIFMSNELMPLVLEDGDRRYLVVYTPSTENGDLYRRVAAFLDDGGAAKLLHYLQQYDLGDFNEHTKPLMTAAKADLIELGMKPAERFMSEWVQGYLALPMHPCSAEQLYRAFRRWCDQAGEKYPPPRAQFTKNAERWIIERVERNADGTPKEPRLTYKVVQLKDVTGARRAVRCWLPRGTGPLNGISEGEWAAHSVEAFELPLGRFCRGGFEAGGDAPVTPDA